MLLPQRHQRSGNTLDHLRTSVISMAMAIWEETDRSLVENHKRILENQCLENVLDF